MPDLQEGPEDSAEAIPPTPAEKAYEQPAQAAGAAPAEKAPATKPPVKKAPAKKAPAKKAPAKKAPATKAPAKKAPAKKAPATKASPGGANAVAAKKATPPLMAKPPQRALEPAPPHSALTAGGNAPRDAVTPVRPPARGARARLPITLGLTVLGLVAVVLSRFRRG